MSSFEPEFFFIIGGPVGLRVHGPVEVVVPQLRLLYNVTDGDPSCVLPAEQEE